VKLRLLESIRCPVCRSVLRLQDPAIQRINRAPGHEVVQCCGLCPFPEVIGCSRNCTACIGYEVMTGLLLCSGCGRSYTIDNGVPRFILTDPETAISETVRTASSFGYLWDRSNITPDLYEPRSYHFEKMERALSLPPLNGLVLDAGCGDGIDMANQARRKGIEIIGIELSDGGCRASLRRSLAFPVAHVAQTDLCRIPFKDDIFDFVYSYGVIHHLPSPIKGLRELVRVLKPGACVAVYLYEDFSDRTVGWRWLLTAANQLRRFTPRFSHRILYLLCQAASPLVYALFTIPFRILCFVPGLRSLVSGFPFRHATGPFNLAGDLYDRFSVPIERRFNRVDAEALFRDVKLQNVVTANDRGWMVSGVKPRQER